MFSVKKKDMADQIPLPATQQVQGLQTAVSGSLGFYLTLCKRSLLKSKSIHRPLIEGPTSKIHAGYLLLQWLFFAFSSPFPTVLSRDYNSSEKAQTQQHRFLSCCFAILLGHTTN